METFPYNIRSPNLNFSDELSDKAVLVADMASGYPLLNKLFTFDPRTIDFEIPCVPDADKQEIMQFYEDNKDVPFYWLNKQDKRRYEFIFVRKPTCRLEGRGDLWRMGFSFRQSSSETS
jgi:hypothetical protein